MKEPNRRGACPGLSAPMPTGDGLLVRLMPTEPVPLDVFAGFCRAARQHGNGTIEISARGSLQVRGLAPRSAPLFASAVAELGIVAYEGVPVIAGFDFMGAELSARAANASPRPCGEGLVARGGIALPQPTDPPPRPCPTRREEVAAARSPHDVTDAATVLRQAIAGARLVLSPKISVVVDDAGELHLDALSADIRLRAAGPAEQTRFCVGLGGDGTSATWLGSIAPEHIVDVVLGLLRMVAAHGPVARVVDILRVEGVEAFHSVSKAWIVWTPAPPRRPPAEMVGLHSGPDGTIAVGLGLGFGQSRADSLAELVSIAANAGARAIRPVPDRAMLLFGVAAAEAVGLTAAAEQLGFVTRADDPRRRIAACPGAPACASGLIPARALASALAPALEPILDQGRSGVSVHISGCRKGCAHPMPAVLTLVGASHGCGIVHDGSARATPRCYVDPANLSTEISRIAASIGEVVHG